MHWLKFNRKFTTFNTFLACGDYCHMLITFANSLDPDQDQHSVHPDLDPNRFDGVFLKEFFEKVNSDKSQQTTTKTLKKQDIIII